MLEDAKKGKSAAPKILGGWGLGACSMTGVRIAGQPRVGVSVIPPPRLNQLRATWSAATRLWWARSISGATTPSAVGGHDQLDPRPPPLGVVSCRRSARRWRA